VVFCVLFMCKCLLPLGVNPIAVYKYININISCSGSKHGEPEVWCHSVGRVRVPYFVGSSEKEVNLEIVNE
jgi:hypothetical protein